MAAFNKAVKKYHVIVIFSCGCHSLNLGIQDSRESIEDLKNYYCIVEYFMHIFNFKTVVSKLQ